MAELEFSHSDLYIYDYTHVANGWVRVCIRYIYVYIQLRPREYDIGIDPTSYVMFWSIFSQPRKMQPNVFS